MPGLVVLSPAVPFDSPVVTESRLRGIPVIGEVELASYYLKGKVIGITGSNGKTTTTALTGHLLTACGLECQVGGNIGTAVTSLIATLRKAAGTCLSFQAFNLETIYRFHAQIARLSERDAGPPRPSPYV